MQLIGPFEQVVPLNNLPLEGPLMDEACSVITNAGILVEDGLIVAIDAYNHLQRLPVSLQKIEGPHVAFPALVDAHTHICFAGDRSQEYAMRLNGASYQEIRAKGGGIWNTVTATRKADDAYLLDLLLGRLQRQLALGIATCEIKSGYGLDVASELKLLRLIAQAKEKQPVQIVTTCLAAHILPKEFTSQEEYLHHIENELWPVIKKEKLATRMDIFIEEGAFSVENAINYLKRAQQQGFAITAHVDQFTPGSACAVSSLDAQSVDHLEMTVHEDALLLAKKKTPAVVLPGATLGLGEPFPPARMLLDTGNCVAISSDWNPGTAPMGNLLVQAALLGAHQNLTMAETWAGITFRAAKALGLTDRGTLTKGQRADIAAFPCKNWQEVLYYQGSLLPSEVFIGGAKW